MAKPLRYWCTVLPSEKISCFLNHSADLMQYFTKQLRKIWGPVIQRAVTKCFLKYFIRYGMDKSICSWLEVAGGISREFSRASHLLDLYMKGHLIDAVLLSTNLTFVPFSFRVFNNWSRIIIIKWGLMVRVCEHTDKFIGLIRFVGYVTTISVTGLYGVGWWNNKWMMNWKVLGRQRSWSHRDTIPEFAWGTEEKHEKREDSLYPGRD